jgi:hypothetical protein
MKAQLSRYKVGGLLLTSVLLAAVIGVKLAYPEPVKSVNAQVPTITVTPLTPNFDVQDPTNLQEAAYFAWQEFIALTWPAPAQGPTAFPRGVPLADGSVKYGESGPTGQVVFETFRHKVEVFPGTGAPNGYDKAKGDLGFSSIPSYTYASGQIPPAPGIKIPAIPPYDNLDEVTQITTNSMYAGVVDPHPNMGGNSQTDQSEKILFQAKVNETHYNYVASNMYWGSDVNPNLGNILFNSGQFVQTGDSKTYPPPYMNLPPSDPANKKLGTIEIKTAWRRLNPKEDPKKFYTARVRYYVGTINNGNPTITGFVDSDQVGETWGLVALHIIQKTPNAPSFIYATFGHINNIVDANGVPVEEPDGTTKPPYVNSPPFIPALVITPPSTTVKLGYQTETTTGLPAANTNSPQLYYHNTSGQWVTTCANVNLPLCKQDTDAGTPPVKAIFYEGPVNVNRRLFMIPPTITSANQVAHQAIGAVNNNAVWLNYRLVNVQAHPIDITNVTADNMPTYYLANEVVETNPSLQRFSGGLVTSGRIFDVDFLGNKDFNVFVVNNSNPMMPTIASKYLMGGCMGCHGSQGQKQGGDFSVLLARGRVPAPDIIQENETQAALMQMKAKARFGIPKSAVSPKKVKTLRP